MDPLCVHNNMCCTIALDIKLEANNFNMKLFPSVYPRIIEIKTEFLIHINLIILTEKLL